MRRLGTLVAVIAQLLGTGCGGGGGGGGSPGGGSGQMVLASMPAFDGVYVFPAVGPDYLINDPTDPEEFIFGDDASNDRYESLFTFDLTRLPGGVRIDSATLLFEATIGDPYFSVDEDTPVYVANPDIGASLDDLDYIRGGTGGLAGDLSYRTWDIPVGEYVSEDVASGRPRASFRVYVRGGLLNDGIARYRSPANVRLLVTYSD